MSVELTQPEPSPQDTALQRAVEDIRQGKFAQARDILTKLLRYDQNNPTYWVWMSAAMETQKERLYCLQAAYKLDPTDATARRGLILMGALPPDDSIQPFPMNHPRPWENKLKLADEKPKLTGIKRLTSNPAFRLAAIFGVAALILGGTIAGLGYLYINRPAEAAFVMGTPRPTVTPYTNANAAEAKATLPPLVAQLDATYTPTVIYEATEHVGVSQDSYRGAIRAYNKGQWDQAGQMMLQVATSEPGSVDAIYFAGETSRLSGNYGQAIAYFEDAMKINANFAPNYLGRARANLAAKARKDILPDLNRAIELDPAYTMAYVERALYYMRKNEFENALSDMEQAAKFGPGSPRVFVELARVQLAAGENEAALVSAKKANELDITSLETYLMLGRAYHANGMIDEAVKELEIYVLYQPADSDAFAILGATYFGKGDYETAESHLLQAIKFNSDNPEAHYWLGELYLTQGNLKKAIEHLEKARNLNETFRNAEALARAYMQNKEWGNANNSITRVQNQANTDEKLGQFYYVNAKANQELDVRTAALRSWKALLALPVEAIPPERRAEAEEQFAFLSTPFRTTPTPTFTLTPAPPGTTPQPTSASTLTPTLTLTPTATP